MSRLRGQLTDPLLSVVMPCYNERTTIEEIIRRVLAVPLRIELIVVDDGSKDGTRDILTPLAAELGFKLVLQAQNGLRVLAEPTADRAIVAEAIRAHAVGGRAGLLNTVEQAAELGQLGEQGERDHATDAENALEQIVLDPPYRTGLHGGVQIVVGFVQPVLEEADVLL